MRQQLPAYSALDLPSIAKAFLNSLTAPATTRSHFSDRLVERFRCQGATLVGSGTQALELAIRLGLGKVGLDATVALPAYSCFDVVTAAVGAQAPILFYDLEPDSLTPDIESLRVALAGGAGVVVVANLYAFPVDWDIVRLCCAESGAVLVEDAAQGLGSSWQGREGGTFGDLTVLSFGRGKGWTGGGGGALLVRMQEEGSEELLEMRLPPPRALDGARAAVTTLAQWGLGRPSLFGLPSNLPWLGLGKTLYKEPSPLRGISSFSAALAAATAEACSEVVSGRRRRADEFLHQTSVGRSQAHVRAVRPLAGGESGYLRFPVLTTPAGQSNLESRTGRSLGIARAYPRTLPDLPAAKGLQQGPDKRFPGAEELSRSLFTLPTHSFVNRTDMDKIARILSAPPSAAH